MYLQICIVVTSWALQSRHVWDHLKRRALLGTTESRVQSHNLSHEFGSTAVIVITLCHVSEDFCQDRVFQNSSVIQIRCALIVSILWIEKNVFSCQFLMQSSLVAKVIVSRLHPMLRSHTMWICSLNMFQRWRHSQVGLNPREDAGAAMWWMVCSSLEGCVQHNLFAKIMTNDVAKFHLFQMSKSSMYILYFMRRLNICIWNWYYCALKLYGIFCAFLK